MKKLITVLILLWVVLAFSQTDLGIGTKWTYSQSELGGKVVPILLLVVGDTIIGGDTWYTLEGQNTCAASGDRLPLIREVDNIWYTHDVTNQNESILYDFNLVAGESYVVTTFGPNLPIVVSVDSVNTITINGVDRQVQYSSNPNSSTDGFFFANEVIRGIGSTNYLLPQGNNCDPHAGPIRCYEDDIGSVDFDIDRDCDAIYFLSNVPSVFENTNVLVFPNPTYDIVSVSLPEIGSYNYIVTSTSGRHILSGITDHTSELELDMSHVESGMYLMQLSIGNQSLISKFVIAK